MKQRDSNESDWLPTAPNDAALTTYDEEYRVTYI
jgi:hypothetical protein